MVSVGAGVALGVFVGRGWLPPLWPAICQNGLLGTPPGPQIFTQSPNDVQIISVYRSKWLSKSEGNLGIKFALTSMRMPEMVQKTTNLGPRAPAWGLAGGKPT